MLKRTAIALGICSPNHPKFSSPTHLYNYNRLRICLLTGIDREDEYIDWASISSLSTESNTKAGLIISTLVLAKKAKFALVNSVNLITAIACDSFGPAGKCVEHAAELCVFVGCITDAV